MNYNMTLYENAGTFFDKIVVIDGFAGGILFPGFLIGLLVVVVVVSTRFSPLPESFFAGALVTSIVSLGLVGAGVISLFWTVGFSLLAAFAGAGLYVTNKT